MMWGRWTTVALLSMTPALIFGQSAAAAAGIKWQLDPYALVAVMAVCGTIEGLFVAWLGGPTTRLGLVQRIIKWMRKPRALAMADRWGPWGGMTLGVAVVGQEPILLALRWLGVDLKRLVLPTILSNILFAFLWYWFIKLGWDQVLKAGLDL